METRTSDDPPLAVRCRGLERYFGVGDTRVQVLRGIDLEVRAGEMTFIVGPSGCGKTTLLSAIAGILTIDAGQIEVFGRDITHMRAGALSRFRARTVGFIFQQFNLLPALTALENASVPLLVQGVAGGTARRAAGVLLERLGIGAQAGKFPSEMSGGQQQRVAIARALVHAPPLVVCDEPTASLDAAAGSTVMDLLHDLALTDQRAVIVVTHDDRIFSHADRMAKMADGRIESISMPNQRVAA